MLVLGAPEPRINPRSGQLSSTYIKEENKTNQFAIVHLLTMFSYFMPPVLHRDALIYLTERQVTYFFKRKKCRQFIFDDGAEAFNSKAALIAVV